MSPLSSRMAALSFCLIAVSFSVQAADGDPDWLVYVEVDDFDPFKGEVTYSVTALDTTLVCAFITEATFTWPDDQEQVLTTLTDVYYEDQCLALGESTSIGLRMTRPEFAQTELKSVEVTAVVDDRNRGFGDLEALHRIQQERITERLLLKRLEAEVLRAAAEGQTASQFVEQVRANQGLALSLPPDIPVGMARARLEFLLSKLETMVQRRDAPKANTELSLAAMLETIRAYRRPATSDTINPWTQ